MKLFHVTPARNLESIVKSGLSVDYAQGAEKAIWCCTESKIHWAIAHTQKRHHVSLEDVIILQVSVPWASLRRAWKGLWRCYKDIQNPILIGTGTTFAASPLEG